MANDFNYSSWTVTHAMTRLDTIVNQHYGDLTMFEAVLKANPHVESVVLNVGVVIVLPIKVETVSEEVLW